MHIVYGQKSFGIENLSQTQIAFLLLPSIFCGKNTSTSALHSKQALTFFLIAHFLAPCTKRQYSKFKKCK